MMRKVLVLATLMIGLCALCPVPVMAATWDGDEACKYGTDDQKELAGCNDGDQTVFDKIPGAVTAVFSVAGIIAVGVIIFGGVRYSVSQGDPGKVKRAKDTIMYAVIGLIVTLSAFAITTFVVGNLL